MSNTWGSLTWNAGNYGAQNDFTVIVSGISASSSLGSQSIELNTIDELKDYANQQGLTDKEIDRIF